MKPRELEFDAMADLWTAARSALRWMAAGVLAFTCASAAAREEAGSRWRLEVLAGQCQAEPLGEGNWYSEHYPHALHLRSRCWQLSTSELTGRWRGWDTGFRLGYADLGSMHIDARWWLRDEDFHRKPDGMSCTLGIDGNAEGCLGEGFLTQQVKGFALGGLIERDLARHLRVGLEVGLFVYEGSFRITVEPYPDPDTYTGWSGEWRGWQLSPYLGATLNSGYFMLSARVYTRIRAAEHGCSGCSGPTRGPATQIAGGMSVPF